MTFPFNNPWVEVWIGQMWVCRQATDVVAKIAGSNLRIDLQTLANRRLRPSDPRLNPLEFHGKRRSKPPRVSASSDLEQATPRPRTRVGCS